jgi:thymidylate kinase
MYLFGDYLVGSLLRVRPALSRGTWVIMERGWWDIAVDPVRYRLSAGDCLAGRLGRLLPRPDLLVLLEAPPETIRARKEELEPDELVRQVGRWRAVARSEPRSLILDSRRPPSELALATLTALGRAHPGAEPAPGTADPAP